MAVWLQMTGQSGHWLISFQLLLIDQLLPGQLLPGQLLPGSPALPDLLLFYVQNQQTLLAIGLEKRFEPKIQAFRQIIFMRGGDAP
jgi:hypothetical protein